MKYLQEEKDAFLNALQLSINSEIVELNHNTVKKIVRDTQRSHDIVFKIIPYEQDPHFEKIKVLFDRIPIASKAKSSTQIYALKEVLNFALGDLTAFLLLTRLDDEQMQALASCDSRYQAVVKGLKLSDHSQVSSIHNVQSLAHFIFKEIENRKLTLRELSQLSGLTQGMLAKFKKGNDLRVSSLLNILDALDLKIIIKK